MAITEQMMEATVRSYLRGAVTDISTNPWWEQDEDRGWDVTITVDGGKFTEEFGGTGDDVMGIRMALTDRLEEAHNHDDDAGFYTFDIFFDDEEIERYNA